MIFRKWFVVLFKRRILVEIHDETTLGFISIGEQMEGKNEAIV